MYERTKLGLLQKRKNVYNARRRVDYFHITQRDMPKMKVCAQMFVILILIQIQNPMTTAKEVEYFCDT